MGSALLLVLLPTVCTAPSVQRAVRVFVSSNGCGFAMAPSVAPRPRHAQAQAKVGAAACSKSLPDACGFTLSYAGQLLSGGMVSRANGRD